MRTSGEQKELILKLEHDLSTIQAMSSLPRPDADGSEVSNMGNIPDPIKEASAMFTGTFLPEKKVGAVEKISQRFLWTINLRKRNCNRELKMSPVELKHFGICIFKSTLNLK